MESFLVLTVPFIFVIIITWLKIEEKNKRNRLQADLYSKAIEKGQTVPTEWFAAEPVKKSKPLNTAIILIAVGVGISLFFWLMSIALVSVDREAADGLRAASSIGVLPFLVGIAFLIIHFLEKKKVASEDAK
jgi:protein-S-isoprenylcysteine O-methyltransferase Ste14